MSAESETTKKLIVACHDMDLARVMWRRGDNASEVLAIVERAEASLARVKERLQAHIGD